jgi:hypothetical protein
MKKILIIIACFGMLSFATLSEATLIFAGQSSGTWNDPTPEDAVFTGVGTNHFTWGVPTDTPNGSSSSVTFDGTSFYTEEQSSFKLGSLTFYNGTTKKGTSIKSVDLSIDIDFTDPYTGEELFSFTFSVFNTNNVGDPWTDADYLYFPDSYPDTSFQYQDENYNLRLLGFSQDEGVNILEQFHVLEGESTEADLYAHVTGGIDPIPEPGTLLLLGSGILGLVAYGRIKLSIEGKHSATRS